MGSGIWIFDEGFSVCLSGWVAGWLVFGGCDACVFQEPLLSPLRIYGECFFGQ